MNSLSLYAPTQSSHCRNILGPYRQSSLTLLSFICLGMVSWIIYFITFAGIKMKLTDLQLCQLHFCPPEDRSDICCLPVSEVSNICYDLPKINASDSAMTLSIPLTLPGCIHSASVDFTLFKYFLSRFPATEGKSLLQTSPLFLGT